MSYSVRSDLDIVHCTGKLESTPMAKKSDDKRGANRDDKRDVKHYGGRGDPARGMALLWRDSTEPPARGRGPRPGLTVDRIIAAATELADGEGLAALSMRRGGGGGGGGGGGPLTPPPPGGGGGG